MYNNNSNYFFATNYQHAREMWEGIHIFPNETMTISSCIQMQTRNSHGFARNNEGMRQARGDSYLSTKKKNVQNLQELLGQKIPTR